jgi:hypothetical protein
MVTQSDRRDGEAMSIVAYYGDKREPLRGLITDIQRRISQKLGHAFQPRPLPEVHATIIGVESIGSPVDRASRARLPRAAECVDLEGLERYVCAAFHVQRATIQFGGFDGSDYGLLSRGRPLEERCFVIDRGHIVVIGWPVVRLDGMIKATSFLDTVRRGCLSFGVRHKYYSHETSVDPDLYMVIGEWASSREPDSKRASQLIADVHRDSLARPIAATLGPADLQLVTYVARSLPRTSTVATPLCNLNDGFESG